MGKNDVETFGSSPAAVWRLKLLYVFNWQTFLTSSQTAYMDRCAFAYWNFE